MNDTAEVEKMLDQLQRESEARRAELRAIAEQLPASVSRTATLRSLASDLRHAPDKSMIVRRAFGKLARAPRGAWRRLRLRGR